DNDGSAAFVIGERRVQPEASRLRGLDQPPRQRDGSAANGLDADLPNDFITRAGGVERRHVRRAALKSLGVSGEARGSRGVRKRCFVRRPPDESRLERGGET